MEHFEIEYSQKLKPLEAVLSRVRNAGDFFVSGVDEIPMPRVEVEGVGTLSFPVPDAQITALVGRAERAPYGRGDQTVVDTSVRNVWQIPPGKVKISGKSWAANFKNILSKVTAGLGCESANVSAELYKLLVYDRGGFFLAHRDTEKVDAMFGTLVVTLPSTYQGGALRIRHAGREVTVEPDAADLSELSYVAFYADCEHAVLPVRKGNRVCLVYNLVQRGSKGRRRIPRAPEHESVIAETATILSRFFNAERAPAKIAWLLEHQYSPAGLAFSALKGADKAKAQVLLRAAVTAQCAVHLGIVHIGQSGAAECHYEPPFRSYRDSSWRDDDDADDDDSDCRDDDDEADFDAVTVDNTWQHIDDWRDTDDRAVKFGRVPLNEGELLPQGALDGEPPDEKRVTEASGNEGASYQRSYRRAGLVLWLQTRTPDVLLEAGAVAAVPYLKQLVASGKGARPLAITVAERILKAWPRGGARWDSRSSDMIRPELSDRSKMLALLVRLRSPDLLERFLRDVVTPVYDGSENAGLLGAVSAMGEARAAVVLSDLVSARMPYHPAGCAELLLSLTDDWVAFATVAEATVAGLDGIRLPDPGGEPLKWEGRPWEGEERQRQLVPASLETLLNALQVFKDGMPCGVAAQKITARPEVFDPVTLVVPAVERICSRRRKLTPALASGIRRLWQGSAEFLLQRSDVPPQPPSDWRLDVKLSCSCPDCRELQAFASNPAERIHRFRVKKERRRHLHGVIDRHRLEMTHVTERSGSPQTLVGTKDRRRFEQRMKEYAAEIAAMRTLVSLAGEFGTTALSASMKAAVKLAVDSTKDGTLNRR